MKQIIFFYVLIIVLSSTVACAADDTITTVGGACAYKEYEGSALITGITPRINPNSDALEVKFLFYPDGAISENFVQVEGRELLMLTKRKFFPNTDFITKNNVEVGKYFDCVLKVIVKGTCPPTIFEFPTFIE